EPAQEGVAEVTYETLGDLVQRIVGVESAVIALTERIAELERDNQRLRGTASVESQRVDRLQHGMKMPNTRSRASMTHEEVKELITRRVAGEIEAREVARNLEALNENEEEQEGENGECTFQDFLKCKPHTFSRAEGIVGLTHWFEKMETVFNISNCPPNYQVKYATCTLQNSALTWWNSHKRTIGVDAAYAMKWAGLMKLMTEVYCPRNELMDKKLQGYAARSAKNKRRMKSNPKDNRGQQPPFKRQNDTGQNVARAYTAGNNERKGYVGSLPYCSKCKLHHEGLYTIRCGNCKKVRHQTRDCRVTVNPNTQGPAVGNPHGVVCYECGRPGHFRKDCPKLRNQNRGNQTRNKTGNKTVDLMPVELGSFDVIIGMDWLAKYHALIVCDEKVVRIPYGNEVLIIRGDNCNGGSKLNIISCTKTQKYIQKGCQVYLAQVTSKKAEDKSEEK
nr:reverse transcriptase domain-containing protein [Tanacetum cinerariifolium]